MYGRRTLCPVGAGRYVSISTGSGMYPKGERLLVVMELGGKPKAEKVGSKIRPLNEKAPLGLLNGEKRRTVSRRMPGMF